jgi:CRISPR-associated protein Csd2
MMSFTDPERRHDFVLLFDVTDGNPNGDPDAGNLPRVDPETMQGLVTDVCMKRKIRDWVAASRGDESRFKIYVEEGAVLNEQHQRAYEAEGLMDKIKKPDRASIDKTKAWMCGNFFDVRMFGAVMSTKINCGQVRGPVQLTFARSINQVVPMDISITRVAVTKSGEDKKTEMGRKSIIPYGLYRAHGFFTPTFAGDTGVDGTDLEVLWDALKRMWDLDRSASRGMLACRGLHVFSHEHRLGNAAAHELFDRIAVQRRENVNAARSINDYQITIDDSELPAGVELHSLVG